MNDPIINKVAASGLMTINLEDYLPKGETAVFDLKDFLFMGLILKEKEFREALKQFDWQAYENKNVAITCTADAIIPAWAYMLVVTYLQPITENVMVGDEADLRRHAFFNNVNRLNVDAYKGQRVVIKGCGDVDVPAYAYAEITRILAPVVKSIMYGEPCSTVPVFKKR